jgi:hypothetical protein
MRAAAGRLAVSGPAAALEALGQAGRDVRAAGSVAELELVRAERAELDFAVTL